MSHLFESIKAGVVHDIAAGRYGVGEVLPPADQLARRHRCSTGTVRRALTELADQGLVRRVRSKGTVVHRRPRLAQVWVTLPSDEHLRVLLEDSVYHALMDVGFDVTLLPASVTTAAFTDQFDRHVARSASPNLLLALDASSLQSLSDLVPRFNAVLGYGLGPASVPMGAGLVMPDLQRMARLTVEHLLQLGHRRIAVMAGFAPSENSFSGVTAAQARDLIEIAGGQCFHQFLHDHNARNVIDSVRQNGVTAYWAMHDHDAMCCEMMALRSGMRVPQQLSIVGRWDTPWSRTAPTPLTTLSLDPDATAQAMTQWLLAKLREEEPLALVQVPPKLIVRQSTVAPVQS